MKLSDYGKKVSEQAYYIDLASKNVNAMYYKSIPDDVEISLERSIGKDYIYDMYTTIHGKEKKLHVNLPPEHINVVRKFFNESDDNGNKLDLLPKTKMYNIHNSDLINDGKEFMCALPMKLDNSEFFYSFNVDANKFAMVDETCANVCYIDKTPQIDFRIEIFENSAFTYNVSENPFAIDNYTILSKDGTNISTRYFGFLEIQSEDLANIKYTIFIPQFLIHFDNGVERQKLGFKYDEYGVLTDSTEHMGRYEKTDDFIISCHPLYIDSFNPGFYYDENNLYWIMESVELLPEDTYYKRHIYKIDPDKLKDLRYFIIDGDETKLLLEMEEE